jgi:hypothetical protein
MAQGRSDKIISIIKWIWDSRLYIKKTLADSTSEVYEGVVEGCEG